MLRARAAVTLLCVAGVVCGDAAQAFAEQDPPASTPPVVAAAAELPSVASLITDLPHDVKSLASIEAALVLGSAAGVSLAVHGRDRDITEQMRQSFGSSGAFDAGTFIGELSVQVGAGVATFVAGRAARSATVARLGADLVRAQILNTAVTHGLKAAIDRRRPDDGRHAFPSGHASATAATAAVLQRHLGWKVGVPAYAVAAYTAASRLVDNHHFLTDVIAGAAIGATIGRAASVRIGRANVVVAPDVRSGTLGIVASISRP